MYPDRMIDHLQLYSFHRYQLAKQILIQLIHPMDLVIDVTIGGESRAYPIRVLRIREMANDVLGGTPILVTW